MQTENLKNQIKTIQMQNTLEKVKISELQIQNKDLEYRISKAYTDAKLIQIELQLMRSDTNEIEKSVVVTNSKTAHIKNDAFNLREITKSAILMITKQYEEITTGAQRNNDKTEKYIKHVIMASLEDDKRLEIPTEYAKLINELKTLHEDLFDQHESLTRTAHKLRDIELRMDNLSKVEDLIHKYNRISDKPQKEKSETFV